MGGREPSMGGRGTRERRSPAYRCCALAAALSARQERKIVVAQNLNRVPTEARSQKSRGGVSAVYSPHVVAYRLHRTLPSIFRRASAERSRLDPRDQARRVSIDGSSRRGGRAAAHPERTRLDRPLSTDRARRAGRWRRGRSHLQGRGLTSAASGARSAIRAQVAHPTQATPPPPGPCRARPGRRRGVRWERGTASTRRNRAQSRGRTRRRRGRRRARRRSRP